MRQFFFHELIEDNTLSWSCLNVKQSTALRDLHLCSYSWDFQ